MSKEEAKAAWVGLVAASKEYLKLPATPDAALLKPSLKEGASNKLSRAPTTESSTTKKVKIEVGDYNKLLEATKSSKRFEELFTKQLSECTMIESRDPLPGESLHVLGLDCEMIHIVGDDMALARLSVVELRGSWTSKEKTVLDELVMPATSKDYIIDTRTFVTGLSIEDVVARGITKAMARDRFLELLEPHTIIIGHAVDHDLLALGINYKRVIDTSLLFEVQEDSERFTHSLSHLAKAILEQETDRAARKGVHDSVEDAAITLRIVRAILTTPVIYAKTFPIKLPKEESAARRRLAGEVGMKARATATRIEVAEGNLASAMKALKSTT